MVAWEEGVREVTGARRLRVWVEADNGDGFDIDESTLAPHPAGFLLADYTGRKETMGGGAAKERGKTGPLFRI